VLLVNGRVRPRLKVRAGKPQRWRIINAAASPILLVTSPRSTFVRIGGDNGLASQSEVLPRLLVVPGERLEVVHTSRAAPGTVATARWVPVDRGYGTNYKRSSEPLMSIATVDLPAVTPPVVPGRLRDIPPIEIGGATETAVELTIQLDGKVVEMGINGVPSWNAKPLHARLGGDAGLDADEQLGVRPSVSPARLLLPGARGWPAGGVEGHHQRAPSSRGSASP
jgi:FtsP/CotA-like multicopper oxidase with cupredoxin domain